jgi:hypothetical protein
MTPLTRKVTRRSSETYRDRSKLRRIVITLYPTGFIGLRLEKTRQEETLPLPPAPENSIASRAAACVQSNRVSVSASRYRNS